MLNLSLGDVMFVSIKNYICKNFVCRMCVRWWVYVSETRFCFSCEVLPVESNPGPQNRKLPPSALTTQTTTHSHATTSHPNKKLLTLLQLNINSITNKHEELKLLVTELQPDIITIQETKLLHLVLSCVSLTVWSFCTI